MRTPGFLILAVVGLSLAGCGGASHSGDVLARTGSTTALGRTTATKSRAPLSKPDYERAMQAVAAQTDRDEAKLPPLPPKGEEVTYFQREAAIYRREAHELATIVPPQEVAADHATLLAISRRYASGYERLALALARPARNRPTSPDAVISMIPRQYAALKDLLDKGYDLGSFTD